MTIVGQCTADDYLLSFWTRQKKKGGWQGEIPPPEKRKETLLANWPYKFPFEGRREVTWGICKISTVKELEQLWMHKSGDWLENHDLWRGYNWLCDLAKAALETGFFKNKNNQYEGPYINYHRWRDTELHGQLDGHEKPMLVEKDNHVDICDGFGRLLPYLAQFTRARSFSRLRRTWLADLRQVFQGSMSRQPPRQVSRVVFLTFNA